MEEMIYWAHLATVEGVGGAIFDQLLKRFGSIKRALQAPLDEVLDIPGLDARTAEAICRAQQTLEATRAKVKELVQRGVHVVTKLDADYPPRLREAANPPPLLYLVGELRAQDESCVAIIGSRECSDVSAKRAREYAKILAKFGISVVSGYAFGVDINAHKGALEKGGRTVIIPGCGVNVFDFEPLKPLNLASFDELVKQAVVISEQPPDEDWSARSALARNRLVAAQARAVLVIEARLHSSTLDTVSRAKNLGRPIFAQRFAAISEKVMGNEMLLREGAGVIQNADDLGKIVNVVKGQGAADESSGDTEDSRR